MFARSRMFGPEKREKTSPITQEAEDQETTITTTQESEDQQDIPSTEDQQTAITTPLEGEDQQNILSTEKESGTDEEVNEAPAKEEKKETTKEVTFTPSYEDVRAQREEEEARLGKLSAQASQTKSKQPQKQQRFEKRTINYSQHIPEAAARLNMDTEKLHSRNPHNTRGTGSSGTQHDVADANAATRAREQIEDAIVKKTGAHMDLKDFIKQEEKKQVTQENRREKEIQRATKQYTIAAQDEKDFKDYIAMLAPHAWRQEQTDRGNDVLQAPTQKGRTRALQQKAKQQKWPSTWEEVSDQERALLFESY